MDLKRICLYMILPPLLVSCGLSGGSSLEEDLSRLDKALDSSEEYAAIKELRIASIENMLNSRGITEMQKYNIYGSLYDEYSTYNFNKSVEALRNRERIAQESGSQRLMNDVLLEKAMLYVKSGLHLEANMLMQRMDTASFNTEQRVKWYDVRQKFLTDYDEYLNPFDIDIPDKDKIAWYQEQILASAPRESVYYRQHRVIWLIREQLLEEALEENAKLIASLDKNTHDYAIATYWHAVIYDRNGMIPEAIHWWTESAISDILCATKDNASLQSIAIKLEDFGETERAFRYTQKSLDDALFYNSMLRKTQIASNLPWIEKAYTNSRLEQQTSMRNLIFLMSAVILVMAASTAAAIYFFSRMRHGFRELSEKNRQLERYSADLVETEESLKDMNRRLTEANEAKEEYLGLFLSQSSSYLDKLKKLISHEEYEAELRNFYKNFDSSFLELYPDFIEKFNGLLKEDARIRPKENDKLTIELRIFALIKLGITQSSHIASLLRYSVNTIYNYRAQIKNSALSDRKDFEELVKKL